MNRFFRSEFVHWLRHGARLIDGRCLTCISEACTDLKRNGIAVGGIQVDGLGGASIYPLVTAPVGGAPE
jgi:hypothetical protein